MVNSDMYEKSRMVEETIIPLGDILWLCDMRNCVPGARLLSI